MFAETTNADRAGWALHALGDFVNRTGVDTPEEAIGDLISDLLHLARAAQIDPALTATRALAMMETELREDVEGDMAKVARLLDSMMELSVCQIGIGSAS